MSVNSSGESGAAHRLRIGELSRRTGVAVDTLRAWERRYDVLRPGRSEGGYRLYTDDDVVRVGAIQALIAEGLSAAEAAAQVRAQPPAAPAQMPSAEAGHLATRLREGLERLDESNTNAVLDEALAGLSLEFVIQTVIFPVLRDIGTEWENGRISIGKEHFATNLLRGRLLGLARGWGTGGGPWAVLACPPQERHDLGLICFGLALWRRGWRIALLGADSPIATIAETAGDLAAEAIVIATIDRSLLEAAESEIRDLARDRLVALGGAGVDSEFAEAWDCRWLGTNPADAAESLDRALASR